MKSITTVWMLLLSFSHLVCQDSLTVDQFLQNYNHEASVEYMQRKITHLNDLSYRLPLIEKVEFRTETNNFDLQQQEYLIRVTPNSIKNRKTQGQYHETVQHMAQMELEYTKSKELRERYELMVELYYSKAFLASHRQHQVLHNDKVTLLRRSSSLPGFDILELINAEDRAQENLHSILDLENKIFTLEKTIKKMHQTNLSVSFSGFRFVTMEGIKDLMVAVSSNAILSHTALDLLSAETYKTMLEYEWETAKSKFSLGYVQAQYGYSPGDPFRKNFSIGLGFDIPLKSTGRLDLNEIQVKILESENEYFQMRNQIEENIFTLEQKLNNLISRHDLVTSHLKDSQAEFALQEYSKIAEASPRALLQLRENTLKKQLLLQELEREIYMTFVEFLDLTGTISQQPETNLLGN